MAKAFQLNLRGLNELMKSSEMQSILTDAATRIAGAAGPGYEIEPAHPISFVAIASTRAADFRARRDNRKNDTLKNAAESVKL